MSPHPAGFFTHIGRGFMPTSLRGFILGFLPIPVHSGCALLFEKFKDKKNYGTKCRYNPLGIML